MPEAKQKQTGWEEVNPWQSISPKSYAVQDWYGVVRDEFVLGEPSTEELTDLTREAIGFGLDVLPGIGDVKAAQETIMGKDVITGEQLGRLGRILSGISILPILPGTIKKLGKKLPKYAESINLEKQIMPREAKELELKMAQPKVRIAHKETLTQSKEILKDLGKTIKLVKTAPRQARKLPAQVTAMRQANVNAIVGLKKLADLHMQGKITPDQFNRAFIATNANIFRAMTDVSSNIGRALEAHKIMLSETDHMSKILSKVEEGLTSKQINALSKINLGDPLQVAGFLNTIEKPKLKDYIMEFWYGSILSGPPTHVQNIGTNTTWQLYQIPHRVHTAMWDKIYTSFTGKQRTRFVNEAIPMMAGYKSGFKRGATAAKEMMRTAQLAEFETKWAKEIGYSALGAWARSENKVLRKLAPLVSAPTRALRAMDVWANAMSYDAAVNAIARRESTIRKLSGDKLKMFERKFKKELPDWAHEEAMKFAKHNTFMDDPDKFTSWFLGLRRVPVLGAASQFVVPFVNTIGNLTKRGIEFVPGVGIGKEYISRRMGRGMLTPEVIAKQVEGSILSLYLIYKVSQGEIVGAPTSKAEREAMYRQGKKPWSIKIGNTWIQFRRMEPYNTIAAMAASVHDQILNAPDTATKTQIFGNFVNAIKNNLFDGNYFAGLQRVFNRYGTRSTAPQEFIASFIPYSSFWRSVTRTYEKATVGDAKVREKGKWLYPIASVFPFTVNKVPAQINVWGEEKIIPGSTLQHLIPYKWSNEKEDVVEKTLATLERYPALPNRIVTIRGKKTRLDDDIYRDFIKESGKKFRSDMEAYFSKSKVQHYLENPKNHKLLLRRIKVFMSNSRYRPRQNAIKRQEKRMK